MIFRRATTVLFLALLAAVAARGDDDDEFYIRSSRRTHETATISPRARALGGSYAALANGASGVYENPAALGVQTDHEMILDVGLDEIDAGDNEARVTTVNVGGAFNLNKAYPGTFTPNHYCNQSAGFAYHHEGVNFKKRDGLESDVHGFHAAYGRSFVRGRYFAGFSVSYNDGGLRDDSSFDRDWRQWQMKIGGIARLTDRFAVGGVLDGATGSFEDSGRYGDPDGDVYHYGIRVGGAFEVDCQTLLLADMEWRKLDVNMDQPPKAAEQHDIWRFSGGVERVVIPCCLTLRGGLYYDHDSFVGKKIAVDDQVDDCVGFTFGGSYYPAQNIDIGYTLDARTNGEIGHMARLEFDW